MTLFVKLTSVYDDSAVPEFCLSLVVAFKLLELLVMSASRFETSM